MIALRTLLGHGRTPSRSGSASLALAAFAALYGCVAQQPDVTTSAQGLSEVPIAVTCTLGAATAEPCRSDAERQCEGTVRLLNVTVAEALPRPMANQGAPGQRVYQATYSCRR